MASWTVTLSFFGASITLAQQPGEQDTWTDPNEPDDRKPERSIRPRRRRSYRMRRGVRHGSRYQSAQSNASNWRTWLKETVSLKPNRFGG